MKLKYYMRGLGIGIVLTTLILTIGNPKEKLSDEAIMIRAKALGMVMKTESNEDLDKALEDIKPSGILDQQPSTAPTGEPTTKPTQQPTPEPTQEPTPQPTSEPTPEPTKEPTPTSAPKATETTDNTKITFSIQRGMSSGQVAALLEEKGIIEDGNDFNQYIIRMGKASVIKVGTFTLPAGASYEDIINEITSR